MLSLSNNARGTALFTAQAVALVLASFFVLLRAYVKVFMVGKVTADDWWMFGAIVIYFTYGVIALHGIMYGGTGSHLANLTRENIVIGLRGWYLCEVLYPFMSATVRTSIAVFLLRIATKPVYRWTIWATLGVVWLMSTVLFFLYVFQCNPPAYFWEQVMGLKGGCMNVAVVPNATIAYSVVCFLADMVIGLLPIPMLWHVKLNTRTKITITVLLSLGVFAGISLLIRIPFVKILAISPDFLYETIDVAIWSVMEPSVGIIAGCMATLRPLFRHWGWDGHSAGRSGEASQPGVPVGGVVATETEKMGTVTDVRCEGCSASPNLSMNSDIELQPNAQSPGGASGGEKEDARFWGDLERGSPRFKAYQQQQAPSHISVQTAIHVASSARRGRRSGGGAY